MNIDELLANAKALAAATGKSKPAKVTKVSPPVGKRYAIAYRGTRCFQFLTHKSPEDISKAWLDHVFLDNDSAIPVITVRHNHKVDEPCASPFMCYEQGYSPRGDENPDFIKLFRMGDKYAD